MKNDTNRIARINMSIDWLHKFSKRAQSQTQLDTCSPSPKSP